MEKVTYLVNFLEEYLVGKNLSSVEPRLLQIFLKSSREALQVTNTQLASYHSTLPQHNERFLGFISAMNEFAEREPAILKVLQRAESEHYLSIEDSLKINVEEFEYEHQAERDPRRESNLSTEDCMINLQALSKVLEKDMYEYDKNYGELMNNIQPANAGAAVGEAGFNEFELARSQAARPVDRMSTAVSTRVLNFLNSYEDFLSKFQECSRGKLSKEVRAELHQIGEYLTRTIASDFYIERLTKIKTLLLDIKRKTTEVVEIAEVIYLAQKVSTKMKTGNKPGSANLDSPTFRNEHRITFDEGSPRLPDSSTTKRSYTQREDKLSSGVFGVKSSFLLAANEWGLTPVQRKTFMHLVQNKFVPPVADSAHEEFTIKEMIANIRNINPELEAEASNTQGGDDMFDYYDYFPNEKPLKPRPKGAKQPKYKDDSSRGSNLNYYHDAMKEGFDPNMATQTTINESAIEQDESHVDDGNTKYRKVIDPDDDQSSKKCCGGCNLI